MDEKAAEMHLRQGPGLWGDGGAGTTVYWTEVDHQALGEALARAADTGVLIMLSRSQDGGALMLGIINDGETVRRWFNDPDAALRGAQELGEYLTAAVPPTPSPKRPGRNGSRPRRAR